MANNITIIRGTSNTFDIPITDANNNPYVLQDGEFIIFGLKKKPKDTECVLTKTIEEATDGAYILKLMPTDTLELECGKYSYDVGIQSGDDFYNVIEPSDFTIQANITKWRDDE